MPNLSALSFLDAPHAFWSTLFNVMTSRGANSNPFAALCSPPAFRAIRIRSHNERAGI